MLLMTKNEEDESLSRILRKNVFSIQTDMHNPVVIEQFGQLDEKEFIASIDLELTCWEGEDGPANFSDEMEVIEIGIHLLRADDYSHVKDFQYLVCPTQRPGLSEFCTKLTGITQEDVDSAAPLTEVLPKLLEELPSPKKLIFASWGSDTPALEREYLEKSGTKEPLIDPRFINVAVHFRARYPKKGGIKTALDALGIKQEEPAHRALPDAISSVKVLKELELTPLDAMVSNDKSLRDRVEQAKKDCAAKLAKRYSIDVSKAEELLRVVHWDFTAARKVIKIIRQ